MQFIIVYIILLLHNIDICTGIKCHSLMGKLIYRSQKSENTYC